MRYHNAPWGGWLVGLSLLSTVLCLGVAARAVLDGVLWLSLGLMGLIMGCALFTIRGYTVQRDALLVHRLLWQTRVSLAGLQSAEPLPGGLSWRGIRIGNGGFFSFSGWSYVPGHGFYRIFVTDPNRKVLLRFADRKVVVSPEAPDKFIRDVRGG